MNTYRKTLTATAAAFAGTIGLLSVTPAIAQPVPTYATSSSDETIRGTVVAINGPYDISVRDERGFVDNVTFHAGTIINPTGLSLASGQSVTIVGHNDGKALAANEIDTPYETLSAVPLYPAFGEYGYRYPYGGYGYGFGSSYRIGLQFGRGYGFHR